jgi:hypothetical protein
MNVWLTLRALGPKAPFSLQWPCQHRGLPAAKTSLLNVGRLFSSENLIAPLFSTYMTSHWHASGKSEVKICNSTDGLICNAVSLTSMSLYLDKDLSTMIRFHLPIRACTRLLGRGPSRLRLWTGWERPHSSNTPG